MARVTRSKAAAAAASDKEKEKQPKKSNSKLAFGAGDIVLVNARSFPTWPAMVVDEKDLAENILAVKPKSKNPFPVLFFNDNNFLWVNPADASSLSPEDAIKASKASKIRKGLR